MTTTSAIFDNAIISALSSNTPGQMTWVNGNAKWYLLLTTSTQPTKNSWTTYTNVTSQLTGTNYSAGGVVMAPVTPTLSGASPNVAQFTCGNTVFGTVGSPLTTTSGAATFGVVQFTGAAANTSTNPLWSYHDFGGGQTVTAGILTLTWAATGVFTITIASAA